MSLRGVAPGRLDEAISRLNLPVKFHERRMFGGFAQSARNPAGSSRGNDMLAAAIVSRSRNNLDKPENRGRALRRPHPYFRGSFGHWFTFREVLIIYSKLNKHSKPANVAELWML
jgi:hypothetical protein